MNHLIAIVGMAGPIVIADVVFINVVFINKGNKKELFASVQDFFPKNKKLFIWTKH